MTGNIISLKPRRSYMDECRARGIHRPAEEYRAELAKLEAIADRLQNRNIANVYAISDRNPRVSEHKSAVEAAISKLLTRCEAILQAFETSGLDAGHFGFLRHVIFETALSPDAAQSAFAAIAQQAQGNRDDQ